VILWKQQYKLSRPVRYDCRFTEGISGKMGGYKVKKIKNYKYKITENDVKKQIKQYLTLMGWFHFHILQGLGSYLGIPDIIAIKNGRVLFLEIKKPGGKLSPGQIIFRDMILSHGGEYYMVDDLNKLMEVIK